MHIWNDAVATRLLFDSSIIAANAYNNLAVSAWFYIVSVSHSLASCQPRRHSLTIKGAFGTCLWCPKIAVYEAIALGFGTRPLWSSRQIGYPNSWYNVRFSGLGAFPPGIQGYSWQCDNSADTRSRAPLIIALGIPRVAFDWGEGAQQWPHRWSRSIFTAFRRCLSSFLRVVAYIYADVLVRSDQKMIRIESILTPLWPYSMTWISPFKIWCCRNVSAPSARWHHAAYKHWVPEPGTSCYKEVQKCT